MIWDTLAGADGSATSSAPPMRHPSRVSYRGGARRTACTAHEATGVEQQPQRFMTTHWSVVLAAADGSSPDSDRALATLFRTYWYPLYDFIRRQGHPGHEAEDLTQEFFARVLEKQ